LAIVRVHKSLDSTYELSKTQPRVSRIRRHPHHLTDKDIAAGTRCCDARDRTRDRAQKPAGQRGGPCRSAVVLVGAPRARRRTRGSWRFSSQRNARTRPVLASCSPRRGRRGRGSKRSAAACSGKSIAPGAEKIQSDAASGIAIDSKGRALVEIRCDVTAAIQKKLRAERNNRLEPAGLSVDRCVGPARAIGGDRRERRRLRYPAGAGREDESR
jgi:hypothetical protein